MREVTFLLVAVVLLPGIICPPVTVKPPAAVVEDADVKPVQDDVVSLSVDYFVRPLEFLIVIKDV